MQSNCVSESSASSASSDEPTAVISTSSPEPISSTIACRCVVVVVDDQQVARAALDELEDLAVLLVERRVLDRLLEHGDRAGAQRVLHAAVLHAARDDVHGDVPRLGVALQVLEHLPAVLHRQAHVEDDRVGLVLVRERDAFVAAHRHDALEAALARHLELGPREVRVVLDDQHDAVAVGDLLAVVVDGRLVVEQDRRVERRGRPAPCSAGRPAVARVLLLGRAAAAGRA